MDNKFYRAFEDRYRGSREVIKQRLNVYVPFVRPLLNIYDDCQATDLGCGRGEWLELMSEVGFTARGVDLNEDMLKACLERGLSVETQDAIAALEHLPDESQMVVSAFHLAEHIPFDDLKELVKEAFRVLKPSGLLILETPNSENLVVGTSSFYLDPSHQRPLPAQLLSFLCEYTGFQRTKILRLQEDAALETASRIQLIHVLSGVSPDCAVVAQKPGVQAQTGLFDAAFERQYGLTLESLAARYDNETQKRFSVLEAKLQQAQAQAARVDAELQAVRRSHSWRLPSPLRWGEGLVRTLPSINKVQSIARDPVGSAIRYMARQRRLKPFVLPVLALLPWLEARLRIRRAA